MSSIRGHQMPGIKVSNAIVAEGEQRHHLGQHRIPAKKSNVQKDKYEKVRDRTSNIDNQNNNQQIKRSIVNYQAPRINIKIRWPSLVKEEHSHRLHRQQGVLTEIQIKLSNIQDRTSNITYQYQVSNIRCQISNNRVQNSDINDQMPGIKYQMSGTKVSDVIVVKGKQSRHLGQHSIPAEI